MKSQNEAIRAAIITGVFVLLAACLGGIIALLDTLIDNQIIIINNPRTPPTSTQAVHQPTDIASTAGPTESSTGLYKPPRCGDLAYTVDFIEESGVMTTNLTFDFPNGYTEGFFTSDPGTVEFSDGQVRIFNTQFTLVTSGFSSIKINGVIARQEPPDSGNWVPNSYGCIYSPQDARLAESEARKDCKIYVDANIEAVLYRVTPGGFELLDCNQ